MTLDYFKFFCFKVTRDKEHLLYVERHVIYASTAHYVLRICFAKMALTL